MANEYDPTNPPMDIEAWDQVKFVFTYPPKVSSDGGVWGPNFNYYILPMVEIRIILIFFATQMFHFVLRRFGFSKITSEILAGLLITINVMNGKYATSHYVEEVLSVIGKFNYLFFLFLMGVKMDITSIRNFERRVWVFGSLIVLLPLLLSVSTTSYITTSYGLNFNEQLALLNLSAIHSMTLFSVIVCVVTELRILTSELGKLALSVATVSDLISTFLYLTVTSIRMGNSQDMSNGLKTVGYIASYIVFLAFVVRPIVYRIIKRTPEGSDVKEKYIFAIIAMAFGFAGLFFIVDLSIFIAPYLLGLSIPSGPPLGSTLESKYNSFIMHAFLPFFVSLCASNANFMSIEMDHHLWKSAVIILIVIILAKFFTCLVLAFYCGLPIKDALTLALVLSSKGVIEIANYTFAWESHIIPNRFHAIAFVVIFMTSSVVPIMVKNLYNPSRKYLSYNKRNLMDSNPKLELHVLACIYRSENISPIIKLIDACAVNKQSPLVVHALHLLTLTGQSTPVFITHELNKKTLSNYSSSKDVILAFKQLARTNPNVAYLHAFTAISPPHSMYEDICTLALDKRVSFIVLPFHRIWTLGRQDYIDDSSTRTLNSSLLEKAPCSLGILIDRGHLGRVYTRSTPSTFKIAMIFLGGKDDREALTLAKRMATEKPETTLDVIHVNCSNDENYMNWESMLDSEVLKDVKSSCCSNVIYEAIWVNDGNHMIEVLRSLVVSYKLVIVGRRYNEKANYHTSDLEMWSDFPELGVLGDLLTTGDFDGDYSLLVVQQQIQK